MKRRESTTKSGTMAVIDRSPRQTARVSLAVAGVIIAMALGIFSSACRPRQNQAARRAADLIQKNVLRNVLREKVKSIDPAMASDYYANVLVSRAYEGLLQYQYGTRPYKLEPALAEAMPLVSRDGLTYTFRIRKGVFFQQDPCFGEKSNGARELVAQDFIYSWNRLLDPKVGASGEWTLKGRIKELLAPDAHTLVVRLTKPHQQFLYLTAMNYLAAVAHEAVEYYGLDFGFHPVGTGPFRLGSFTANEYIWMRNPQYYGSKSSLEGIRDIVLAEDQPALMGFLNGEYDVLTRVPQELLAPGGPKLPPGAEVLKEPAADFTYFALNMAHPLIGKNRFLRQAMSLAYDIGPVIEKFYGGLALKAEFLIPPGIGGYDPTFKNAYTLYNLVKARQLLAQAGYPEGRGLPEFSLDAPVGTQSRLLGEYFVRSLAQLGVRVRLNLVLWPELLARVQRRQGEIYSVAWVYDYPDPENGFQILYGPNESPGPNKANYHNPELDRLLEKLGGPLDSALIAKMRALIVKDAPWIFGVHRLETRLVQGRVKNYKISAFDYGIEKYLKLDIH